MTPPGPEPWRLPPRAVLLAAVVLLLIAEIGGASMSRFKVELTRWARGEMLRHPAVHGLVGVRDVDERVLDEALFRFDTGLRLFHMHAEGMALVIIATTTAAATLAERAGLRRALVALLTVGGVGYPLGYLMWSALIPAWGVERSKGLVEWLVWIPFGGATIVALLGLAVLVAARMVRRSRAAGAALLVVLVAAGPAAAHHTGVYTPKDNAITTNFKQLKFSAQAGKFEVARRLFDEGPLRAEMRARAAALPSGLEARTRAALEASSAPETERALMIFFVALARDLAREGERQVAAGAVAPATAQRFLEAIWRYYNLVDFAVSQHDARGSAAMRLAFEDAEGAVKDPARSRIALRRVADVLGEILKAAVK